MKRFWPELAVILLGLTAFACLSFADGRSCGCANCQCQACPADCPTQFVTADDGTQYRKVCQNGRCFLVPVQAAAQPMPKGPAPVVATPTQTEEPPLAAPRPLLFLQRVVSFVLHPFSHRRHK